MLLYIYTYLTLQPENVDLITTSMTATLQEMCPDDQNLNSKAEEVAAKYKLFKLYGTCHRGINSGSILCENDEAVGY